MGQRTASVGLVGTDVGSEVWMSQDEMTPGEIARDLRVIHTTLEEHRKQISDVRHEERSLRQKFEAYETIGNYVKEAESRDLNSFKDEVRSDIDEIKNKLEPIHDFVTGQRDVATYRKWAIGMAIALGSLLVAFLAFIASTLGGTG